MATDSKRSWFRRAAGSQNGAGQARIRVLTASATRLKLEDKKEARQQRALRQGWQSDAWNARDSIGELRYAVGFLANCAARMRLYPAAYPTTGESDVPVPLEQVAGGPITPNVVALAQRAMGDLGNGRLAIGGLLESLSQNLSVAGECFLLGRADDETGKDVWTIRSVDEVFVAEDEYKLRELPQVTGVAGGQGWERLDPARSVVSRIWTPHPRFQLLADSPCRALMDDMEALLILRRMIRATGRSRLAGRGLLLVPDELSIKVPTDDDDDPQADPVLAAITDAMITPISDEGVASAVVPIVLRGPGDVLEKLRHIDFASQFDADSSKVREELVGIIATGLDLPKEILMGMGDINHWGAWQVDDNTFRHHVEPHVIKCCDALAGAYLRPYLVAAGVDRSVADRILFWYDPTELVTHPDQTADAMQMHDRLVLSDAALLRVSGFSDEDAPSKAEIQVRLLEKMRMWPPNLVMAFLHAWDPTLAAPPITVSGTIPGIGPGGVDTGEIPAASGNGTTPPLQGGQEPPPPAPSLPDATPQPTTGITAAGKSDCSQLRLSQKLMAIDRDLRSRLQQAASAAMLRQLEKAGARLRTKTAKDETSRTKIAQRPNALVAALLGEEAVTAAGLSAQELMGGDWSALRKQFMEWTEAAQRQAIVTACRIGHLDSESDAARAAADAMAQGRDRAWEAFAQAMGNLGHHLLYHPHPNDTADVSDLNPDTLVPTGVVRAVLAMAGGEQMVVTDLGTSQLGAAAGAITQPVGQIGTGATISDLLAGAGAEREGYEWHHGPSLDPFEPHENLDGVQFQSFDDDVLANPGDWPPVDFFLAGDHTGCSCDAMPLWLSPE